MTGAPTVVPIGVDDGRVRVVIEGVEPTIDGGRFPVKRVLGDLVEVEADCFADGHDVVACVLLWRRDGAPQWRETPMRAIGNDRWRAGFVADRLGDWQFTVRAWVDPFQSWRRDYERRVEVDDLRLAARAGAALIAQAARRAAGVEALGPAAAGDDDAVALDEWGRALARAADAAEPAELARIALDARLAGLAARHPDLRHAHTHPKVFGVCVERERARFSAWYEFFPRSASGDGARHGTFSDCVQWLPYVHRMGFDVVYFPPIHPIGRTRRKGRNNALAAQPGEPGSPWAIGAAEGGHDAVLGELGTLEQFRSLVRSAETFGIEIALDVALQCSPDHPWLAAHPQWFRARPDGSIQYAENPPKKYQDIYPFDFETPDWRALWLALAGVIEFWIGQGVRIFRVDNPHTKSLAFWEWVIARVRRAHPEVVFLSEAFTRPKLMHRLAKLGFSQSYTYYTWRNTKREITEYFSGLAHGPSREYFRPNVWPNTPDILPAALQYGGRPAFMARVAMAATLSANYGIYGPAFELLEHEAIHEGAEEYRDSEKYQLRAWDRQRPESLAPFVAALNRARRENAALRSDAGLRFQPIDNDALIAYSKSTPDRTSVVVCVVNLDPHHPQSGWLELDPAEFGLGPDQPYQMHDAISHAHFLWHGARNYVSLDPERCPVHVLELRPRVLRENDFDYFL
ncbi:MAG: alpha-1,4-glucan--maltose-1-phosphate maltosyltransferase [Burkholderiaceae bacterium]